MMKPMKTTACHSHTCLLYLAFNTINIEEIIKLHLSGRGIPEGVETLLDIAQQEQPTGQYRRRQHTTSKWLYCDASSASQALFLVVWGA